MSRAAAVASDFLNRGWCPIPIPSGMKCPRVRGWTELRITQKQVDAHFGTDPLNIGILLGEASGDLVDVDLDCSEACAIAAYFLPPTNSVFGRRSKPTSHYLFVCKNESKAFKDPERGDTLLEIRSNGHQTVFPTSIHPSGELVEWYEDGDVAEVAADRLLTAIRQIAAVCVIARRWPAEGGRHHAQLVLSAVLIRAGWSVDLTARFVEGVSLAAGAVAQMAKRIATARDAERRLRNGDTLYGWPSLRDFLGDKVTQQAAEWLSIAESRISVPIAPNILSGDPTCTAPILTIGSDVEIAKRVTEDLRTAHGDVVFDEGQVWHYDGTSWQPKSDRDLRLLAYRYDGATYGLGPGKRSGARLNKSRIDSILFELCILLSQKRFFADATTGMNCASGFIAFDSQGTPQVIPHSADHKCRYVLRGRWPLPISDEQAQQSLLSKLLSGVFAGDSDADRKIDLVGEVAAAAALGIATRLVQPRAVVLFGQAAENGKSQILDLIREMLPIEAVSAVPLHRFGDDKYLVQLAGKFLNASDELASAKAIGSESFKLVITGDPVSARDVYRAAVHFRCAAQHVFATNHLPSFQGGMDRGVRRRLRVLTFNRTIPEDARIPEIGRRICREEPDLALDFFVQGAGRLIRQGRFSEPPSSLFAEREWLVGTDPVLSWLEEAVVIDGTAQPVLVRDAHRAFVNWAKEEGFSGETLPVASSFTQRVLAAEASISRYRTGGVRYLRGLRIALTASTLGRAMHGRRSGA